MASKLGQYSLNPLLGQLDEGNSLSTKLVPQSSQHQKTRSKKAALGCTLNYETMDEKSELPTVITCAEFTGRLRSVMN